MYCLDCGTKINDDELQCSNCGSSVADMKERIAQAEEMVAYTDAVDPLATSKLPLVSDRTYIDKDGNPLDPSKKVDVADLTSDPNDLRAIPEIGEKDPYITKPMQRIVSDSGKVVADVDREAKSYRQDPPPIKMRTRVIGIIVCLFVAFSFMYVNGSTWLRIFGIEIPFISETYHSDETAEGQAGSSESTQETEDAAALARRSFINTLGSSYVDLGAWRIQIDSEVEGLEGYYGVVNRETRSTYADSCSALATSIADSQQVLADSWVQTGLSEDDPLYAEYQKVDELYGYLLTRVGVLYQCWEVSLTYDDPRGHDSEILAPLTIDLKGGSSVSEKSFDAAYDQAKPTIAE